MAGVIVPFLEAGLEAAAEEELYTEGFLGRIPLGQLPRVVNYRPAWDWITEAASTLAGFGALYNDGSQASLQDDPRENSNIPSGNSHSMNPTVPRIKPRTKAPTIKTVRRLRNRAAKLVGTQPISTAVSQPAAKSQFMRNAPPVIQHMTDGRVVVRHREYIGDFAGSGSTAGYILRGPFPLDPAEPLTFPWLANMAVLFEQFKFRSLKLHAVTEATTSSSGSYFISYDPNAGRIPPSSKIQQLEIQDTARAPIWQSSAITCKVDQTKKYVNPFNVNGPNVTYPSLSPNQTQQTVTDIRTCAAGVVYVGLYNAATSSQIELWVEYEVELIDPTLSMPPWSLLRMFIGPTTNSSFLFNDYIGLNTNAPNFNVFGNVNFQITGGNNFQFQPAGNCMLMYTIPTSSATGGELMTFSGATGSVIAHSINSGSFTSIYVLTGVIPGTVVTATQGPSWTNLNPTAANPAKIYIVPYDAVLPGTVIL